MSWEFVAIVLSVLVFMLLTYVHVLKTRLLDAMETMQKLETAHRELLDRLKAEKEPAPTLWDVEEFKQAWLFERWDPAPSLEDERQGRPIRVYLWGKTSVFTRYQTIQMQNELDRVSPGTKLLLEEVKQ